MYSEDTSRYDEKDIDYYDKKKKKMKKQKKKKKYFKITLKIKGQNKNKYILKK